jgi:hypothetical protein
MDEFQDFIDVSCQSGIIEELANNNCPFLSLLCELIDNVAAELEHCQTARVHIKIGGPWTTIASNNSKVLDLQQAYMEVSDNATGIKSDRLAHCLSLAAKPESSGTLHEHGLGMKTAIMSLGKLDYLITKTKDEDFASRIDELTIGKILRRKDTDTFKKGESGTIIRLKNLKPKVYKEKRLYLRNVIDHLGARYARLLTKNQMTGRKLDIQFDLLDENDNVRDSWTIQPCFPFYENNGRNILKEEFGGNNWGAQLEFGFTPSESEYIQNGLEVPANSHPYKRNCRVIDVVHHDRVLCRLGADDLYPGSHYMFAPFVGVLTLRYGFRTSMTKDGVLRDENWNELLEKVVDVTKGLVEEYVRRYERLTQDEKDYRDQLYQIQTKGEDKEVLKEFAVEGTDGNIDLLVNDEVWELKAEQAQGIDVYQVLYYIDTCDKAKKTSGRLIAPSFSDGCKWTAQHLKKTRKVDVKLKTFEDVGLVKGIAAKKKAKKKSM